MGSLAVVIVVDVLSCSRTLSTARFHNCRLRDGIPLGFPVAEGLASNDGDSFLDITGERAKKHLMNDRNKPEEKSPITFSTRLTCYTVLIIISH